MGERWILGDLRNAVNQLESALRVQPGSELNCLDTRFLAPLENDNLFRASLVFFTEQIDIYRRN